MLTIDPTSVTVSRGVNARAALLAGDARSMQYGYLDATRLAVAPRPGAAALLWRVDARYQGSGHTRRVEVHGGAHPHAAALLAGPVTVWCSCPAHEHRRLCAHVVATLRRATIDHT